MREVKLNTNESSKLVLKEVSIFLHKARIQIKAEQNISIKLQKYNYEWKDLQKLYYRETEKQLKRNEQFILTLNDLFDITFDWCKHSDRDVVHILIATAKALIY